MNDVTTFRIKLFLNHTLLSLLTIAGLQRQGQCSPCLGGYFTVPCLAWSLPLCAFPVCSVTEGGAVFPVSGRIFYCPMPGMVSPIVCFPCL